MASLDIIIVNWNAGEQLKQVLESIHQSAMGVHQLNHVVVVDNASNDDSINQIRSLSPLIPLQIIENKQNQGFGKGCNQGAKASQADYLLFLNPDTQLEADALPNLLDFMQSDEADNQRIGIIGGQLIDDDGTIARSCDRFITLSTIINDAIGLSKLSSARFPGLSMTDWDHHDSRIVDHVMGAMYCIRRELFETLNGFDEQFFVYMEDMDLTYRAHQLGWYCYYDTSAQTFHRGGGTTEAIKARRLALFVHSRIKYALKHFPMWQVVVVVLITFLIEPLTRMSFALLRGNWIDAINSLRGYLIVLGWILFPKQKRFYG